MTSPWPVLPDLRVGLNFQQLHLFYRVAKLGSIPRAAEELRVAQSSVSAQLQEFEQRCGVDLLHRLPTGLTRPPAIWHSITQKGSLTRPANCDPVAELPETLRRES